MYEELANNILMRQSMEKAVEVRERTLERPNWNLCVGDRAFETDMFLRFRSPYLEEMLSNMQIRSNTYSYAGLSALLLVLSLRFGSNTQVYEDSDKLHKGIIIL